MIELPHVLRFRKARGLMQRRLVFTDGFETPKLWVEEESKGSTDLWLYADPQKTNRLALFHPEGLSPYTAPFTIKTPAGETLGSVVWQGGPVVSKWFIQGADGREMLSHEVMSHGKYAAKLLAKFIPITIDTSMKTGTLTLFSKGQIVSKVIRSGSWFTPLYEIADVPRIATQIEIRLLLAAMSCEAMFSNN
jgi:hypothetical protein